MPPPWLGALGGVGDGSPWGESPRIENKGLSLPCITFYHRSSAGIPAITFKFQPFSGAVAQNPRLSGWGPPGSKQRLQRASYTPVAPTTISSLDSTSRCVCLAG